MNIFKIIEAETISALKSLVSKGKIPEADFKGFVVEPPKDKTHGDIAVNAAMVLAKRLGMKPIDIAELIANELSNVAIITSAKAVMPGFINISLNQSIWYDLLKTILTLKTEYGSSDIGKAEHINIEYVSANPTGPMHIGHARGAVFGDALAGLLAKAGYKITKEYYINDAGSQIDTLARSGYLRYLQALGDENITIPEGLYPGEYLIPIGKKLADEYGDKFRGKDESEWLPQMREKLVAEMMNIIRSDLDALGIRHDVFTSEKALHSSGLIEKTLKILEDKNLIYTGVLEQPKGKQIDDWEPRPQTLFKSSEFGDDVDRALKKSDESWTYFAADIAYHQDKLDRKYTKLIDVLGADHGGYVKRMKAAVKALSDDKVPLDIRLIQLVNLTKNGEQVKMSKRSGSFITLREVVDEVGKDVVRFIMLTRKNDVTLDFDMAKVTEQSRDNPVFYVQYAHARAHSVLRLASQENAFSLEQSLNPSIDSLTRLNNEAELDMIKLVAEYPRIVEQAAESYEPHRITFYLMDLAASFHSFWNMGKEIVDLRFVVRDDSELTIARLALVRCVATVIASGLEILGVKPVEELRS